MSYNVKLEAFEGPFDLLVYLIEKSQMDIYNIQISVITSQYLEHLEQIKKLNVEVVSEFLVLAATLIEIKSKMLLPNHEKEEGVLEAEDDPRNDLVQKILEYRKFKNAVEILKEKKEIAGKSIYKVRENFDEIIEKSSKDREHIDIDIDSFVDAFNTFLKKRKRISDIKKRYQEIEGQRISIDDRIYELKHMLKNNSSLKFSDIINYDCDKHEIIVTFVSILELLKERIVVAIQDGNFEEIIIKRVDGGAV